MIRRAHGLYRLLTDVMPRVELAHGDLGNVVRWLRSSTVEIYTVVTAPGTVGVERYSVSGWRQHFQNEYTRFSAFRQTEDTLLARQRFADVDLALADYIEALPRVLAAFDNLLSRYQDAGTVQQAVTVAHRRALADAIVAELA